jgi:hypothetical protein
LSVCDYSAEPEMRWAEGEGEMIFAAILALTIEYGTSQPMINPQICSNIRRVSGGYQITEETWVLQRMKLLAGTIIRRGRTMVAGRDLVALIEATCAPANS